MASNFEILVHRNSDNLHLKLIGDFDGNSASELLDELLTNGRAPSRVFVHTSGLQCIHASGREIFQSRFHEVGTLSRQILFTGQNASRIAPKSCICL